MSCPGINFQYPIFCYITVPLYISVMSFAEQHHQYNSKSYFFCFVVISNLDLKLEVILQAPHLFNCLIQECHLPISGYVPGAGAGGGAEKSHSFLRLIS